MTTLDRAALSIEEAYRYMSVGRATLYRLLGQGAIRSFHVGRRHLVLRADLDAFMERLAVAGADQGRPDA
jgi:excisionase family DNA binding protein